MLSLSFIFGVSLFLPVQEPAAYDYYVPFVNRTDTRLAIHVGNLSYGAQSVQVETSLLNVGVVGGDGGEWGAQVWQCRVPSAG